MPTPLAYFGYPLDAGSDGLGKPPELTDLLPVYGQDQYHRANQKAQRTTQLTPAARAKLERSGNFVAVPAIVIARMPRQ